MSRSSNAQSWPPTEAGLEDRQRGPRHSMAESRDLLKAFLAGVPVKCENCGCASPKINPEGANKIYRQGLTGKQRETNAGLGIDLETELADLATADGEGEDGAELVGQEVEPDAALARKKRKKKRGDGSEDGSGSDQIRGSIPARDRIQDDDGSGSDDDDDEKKKKKASSSTGASGAGATARAGRQVYVTPIEARALLKKLWSAEYDFCSMVWVANAPAQDPVPRGRALGARATKRPLAVLHADGIGDSVSPASALAHGGHDVRAPAEHAPQRHHPGEPDARRALPQAPDGPRAAGGARAARGARLAHPPGGVNKLIDSSKAGAATPAASASVSSSRRSRVCFA